jgi:hypothetical protein
VGKAIALQLLTMVAINATLISSVDPPEPRNRTTASVPAYNEGRAVYYRQGLMERVAARRGLLLGQGTGFVTHPDCRKIGSYMMVSVWNPVTRSWSAWSKKRIADCSQPRDYARHVAAKQVEFSYADAQKYKFAVNGKTRVRWYLL